MNMKSFYLLSLSFLFQNYLYILDQNLAPEKYRQYIILAVLNQRMLPHLNTKLQNKYIDLPFIQHKGRFKC